MSRHTKIVATLGPASSDPAVLERLVEAGIDVVRLNFSHGSAADHMARAVTVREVAARAAAASASSPTCRAPRSGSASSKKARSPWKKAPNSSSMPAAPWAMPSGSGWITRICPGTCSPATSCCSTMAA